MEQSPQRLSVADVRRLLVRSRGHQPQVLIGVEADLPPQLDNTACLVQRADGSWEVSYFERGSYFDQRVFGTEDGACRDFLAMLRIPVDG